MRALVNWGRDRAVHRLHRGLHRDPARSQRPEKHRTMVAAVTTALVYLLKHHCSFCPTEMNPLQATRQVKAGDFIANNTGGAGGISVIHFRFGLGMKTPTSSCFLDRAYCYASSWSYASSTHCVVLHTVSVWSVNTAPSLTWL